MPLLYLPSLISPNLLSPFNHRPQSSSPLSFHLPFSINPSSNLKLQWRRRRWLLRCFPAKNGQKMDLTEAREAVVELLRDHGASEEESLKIASNSPKYVASLIENVRELDEDSLWSSWSGGNGEEGDGIGSVGFKRKVYYMAKSKRDGGMVAFLESVGLKHSSAVFIARYLASESLPEMIRKVTFLKDMLFTSSSHEELIGKNARRMMKHLSISTGEDIHRTLSFFQKLDAKHGGLNTLGYEDSSFSYLIESFRDLLLLSVENHLIPLVDFLEQIGVPKKSARIILLLFPPIFFLDIEKDIKPKIRELEKAGVEDRHVGRMLLKYPWILSTKIQENYDKILKFFRDKKVPKLTVDTAIRSWPHLLGCTTDTMEPIVHQFGELGVKGVMLGPVLSSSPQLLLKKPDELLEVISFMEEIGFDGMTTGKILCRCPEIFAASVENTLRRKVKFLTDFGISKRFLVRVIRKYPELLLLDTHHTLLPRMRFLVKAGLLKREVCSMVCKFSPLLGYSVEAVLKPKLEFLLRTMQKPLSEVVEYPRYFSYSLEKKIKRRYFVLKSRNIECSLKDMLGKNDEEFAIEYMNIDRLFLVHPPPAPSNDDPS